MGLPFPTPAMPSGPYGSPSKATVSILRVLATGRVVGRVAGPGQMAASPPANKPAPFSRRHHDILGPCVQSWGGELMAELRKRQVE